MLNGLSRFSETDYLKKLHDDPSRSEDSYITLLPHDPILSGRTTIADKSTVDQILDQFYTGSLFRHLGFWDEHIEDARAACENLMDEIMALIPEKKGTIIDIGCGFGASTQYLARHFPAESITGIANDLKALDLCKLHHPDMTYLYQKLPRLNVSGQSFDVAMYVKGFHSLGDRKKLLKACYNILKPEGRLACFDVLYNNRLHTGILKKIGIKGQDQKKIVMYEDMLHAAGFVDLEVIDVTQQCIVGFIKHMTEYFQFKRLSQDIGSDYLAKAEMYLENQVKHVAHCLLVSGIKQG
jgi:ubiquinone/menaquinone biosynthesis C-methylase UbiE